MRKLFGFLFIAFIFIFIPKSVALAQFCANGISYYNCTAQCCTLSGDIFGGGGTENCTPSTGQSPTNITGTSPSCSYPTFPGSAYNCTAVCAAPAPTPTPTPTNAPCPGNTTCAGGNISKVDFGIANAVACGTACATDSDCTGGSVNGCTKCLVNGLGAKVCTSTIKSWFQGTGGDLRLDNGFIDKLPTNVTYAAVKNANGSHGIIFTGDKAASFMPGGISSLSPLWIVGGTTNKEVFKPARTDVTRAAYAYEDSLLSDSGITPNPMPACTAASPCSLSTITNGVYRDNSGSDVYIGTTTFIANKNYVFLIKGNMYIMGKITVPVGATASFFVQGNILVDSSVGESTLSSTATDVEGFYASDKNFIIQSSGNVPMEKRLNVGGAVVANAALNGGTIQNLRDLGPNDVVYPTETITERPDMILNAPQLIENSNYEWRELAP